MSTFPKILTKAMCESGGQTSQVGPCVSLIWTRNLLAGMVLVLWPCSQHAFRRYLSVHMIQGWCFLSAPEMCPFNLLSLPSHLSQSMKSPSNTLPSCPPSIPWVSGLPKSSVRFSAQYFSGPFGDYQLAPLLGPHRTQWGCDPRA